MTKTRAIFLKAACVFAVAMALASCASKKDFVYLQDMRPGMNYPSDLRHEGVIHRDDRLAITVSSRNMELAIPFNIRSGSFRVSSDGTVTESAASDARDKGYRVDVDGYIEFPILGRLKVEGLTLSEATDLIRDRIVQGSYIRDPLVSVEFLNFRYTVLGAVSGTGVYNADYGRVTLLDAIAKAGDLSSKARVDKVTVIREEGGDRRMYTHDMRSMTIFDSPAFYLQQNDIVYVEPKYKKKDGEDRSIQYASLLLSLASVVTSVFWVLK